MKHIKLFEQSMNESPMTGSSSNFFNNIVCITDYSGTIAVGSLAYEKDEAHIKEILEKDKESRVTVLNYEAERSFVSYDDEGIFELFTDGDNYKVGTGFVFPMLQAGQFLCVFASGDGIGTSIVDVIGLKRVFGAL
jgi:hypothetical protein